MFTSEAESAFFMKHIDDTKRVLEYGSGESTTEIAKKCKWILSMEHQPEWFEKIMAMRPKNCVIRLCPPQNKYYEGWSDGDLTQFNEYVTTPLLYDKFDIILIDGRARVECSKICKSLATPNCLVFIHDFEREEYQGALEFLDLIDMVETMVMFKVKTR